MTRPAYVEDAIARAYKLEAVLRVTFEAAFEDDSHFNRSGGSAVIDMAADMAGEIIEGLELGEKSRK